MKLKSARPTRAVVFAVMKGFSRPLVIMHPTRSENSSKNARWKYARANPRSRAARVQAHHGGGGTGRRRGGGAAPQSQPVQRKRDRPAVYWSGIVDVQRDHEFSWTVPDTFNGTLKIFALSVNGGSIGVAQGEERWCGATSS